MADDNVVQLSARVKKPGWGPALKKADSFAGQVFWPVVFGGLMSLMCYLSWLLSNSIVIKFLGAAVYKIGLALTTKILSLTIPSLIPFAPWILFGAPALIFGYHVMKAALAGNLMSGESNSLRSFIYGPSLLAFPLVGFSLGLYLGVAMKTALWIGGITASLSYSYWAFEPLIWMGLARLFSWLMTKSPEDSQAKSNQQEVQPELAPVPRNTIEAEKKQDKGKEKEVEPPLVFSQQAEKAIGKQSDKHRILSSSNDSEASSSHSMAPSTSSSSSAPRNT